MLIGVAAGLAMTLLFPLYTLAPALMGWAEPMPALSDMRSLTGLRFLLAVFAQISNAVSSAMLGGTADRRFR